MVDIFLRVVLPVFLMAGAGALLQRWRPVPVAPLSQVTLYLFVPALLFTSLAESTLALADIGEIALFVVAFAGVMLALSWGVARLLRMDRSRESAFFLTTLFMNAGNFGLPVVLLAFGQRGLERGVVFFALQAVLGGTLAVFLASRSHRGIRSAIAAVFQLPSVYAASLGLGVNLLGLTLPVFLGRPLEIMAGGAVPTMLLVLGFQLAARPDLEELPSLGASALLRLAASPVIAFLLTLLLDPDPLLQKVLIVQASMPSAVFLTILATQFDARPRFVANAVLVSTIASVITVTLLLTVVGGEPGV